MNIQTKFDRDDHCFYISYPPTKIMQGKIFSIYVVVIGAVEKSCSLSINYYVKDMEGNILEDSFKENNLFKSKEELKNSL